MDVHMCCLSACVHTQEENLDSNGSLENSRSTLCLLSCTVSSPQATNVFWLFLVFLSPCCQSLDFSPLSFILFISYNIASLPLCPSFCLAFSESFSQQQVQAPTPQPSPGPPLVPATSQPAPPGTPLQVKQLEPPENGSHFLYIQTVFPSLLSFHHFSHTFNTTYHLMSNSHKDKIEK